MRLDFGARLASYVALGLSCACIMHAEALFLPGIAWLLPVVLGLLVASYRLEGRWALPVWSANLLAVLICGGMAIILRLYVQYNPQSFAANVPFPVAIVPYAGPPCLVLLIIKLFRARRPGDLWQLQAMGVLQAGLACVLGGDPLLGLLLCAYSVSGLWWLSLHCLERRQERGATSVAVTRIPWRWAGIPRAARWLFVAMACGLVLALITPRISPSPWNPLELLGTSQPGSHAETGVPNTIDLNREGTVELNDEIVMEIEAKDAAGNPKLDLPATQRFRGAFLDHYADGRWIVGRQYTAQVIDVPRVMPKLGQEGEAPPGMQSLRAGKQKGTPGKEGDISGLIPSQPRFLLQRYPGSRLPNLGPNQYFLTFTLQPRKAGGLFLADPVLLLPEIAVLPVVPLNHYTAPDPLFSEVNGALVHGPPPKGDLGYRQVTRPVDDPDLGPPVDISPYYELNLVEEPPKSLRDWTLDLARRLAATPGSGLEEKDINGGPGSRRPQAIRANREKVARALCNYLRDSGEYTYTLDLRRQDQHIDPTEDFLSNVKQGHCQRYAAGLTLMLRSLGIPARIVKGFRGCEDRGDGTYFVRNSNAHVWVEALIVRTGSNGRNHQHWLALDPTPFTEAPPPPPFSLAKWWEDCQILSSDFWRFFISEYGTEEQHALANELWSKVAPGDSASSSSASFPIWLLTLPLAVIVAPGVYFVRRRRRRRSASISGSSPTLAFYARLLDLLARHARLIPTLSQTPREFGATAGQMLGGWNTTAALSDLPSQVAALFYRARFGGKPLAEDERLAIDQRLDDLALALTRPRPVAAAAAGG